MGKPGKIAFPVILVLGAITGYITYTSFTAVIPDENIDSPYYQPLSPGSSGNVPGDTGGAAQQQGGGANTTTTTTTAAGGANATTTAAAGGAPMSNATTTGTTGNATGTGTTGGEGGGGGTSVSIVPGSSSLTTDAFQPNPIQVGVGDTVTWTNDDAQPHTATSGQNATPDGTFDSGIMAPQGTFEHTFTEAGEFPYFCLLHPNMVGTVSVS
jgi:plastocyanin